MAMGLGLSGRTPRVIAVATIHLLGAALGGAATGLALGLLGAAVLSDDMTLPVIGVGVVMALVLALRRPDRSFGLNRQVPRHWMRVMSPASAYLLWGAMLGTGIVTLIPYSSFIVLAASSLTAGPVLGAAIGAAFGFAREAPTFAALLRQMQPPELLETLPRWRSRAQVANTALAVAGGILVVLANA